MALKRYPKLEELAKKATVSDRSLEEMASSQEIEKIEKMAEELRIMALKIDQTSERVERIKGRKLLSEDEIDLIARRALIS